ncbi:MAG TPA: hypothetical protein VM581_04555, partial [Magnetospirillaceae bacterium]|nr:hypothetical protein [Magnetospirillaceae bacterium]
NNTTGDGSTTTTSPDTTLIVTISRAGQSAAGQPINVRTIVNGTSSGTCDMTFSRAGSSFTKTFPIAISASTITCNGDVEASAFSGGEWQISVVAKNGSASSQPTTTTFVVTP